jgi:hypothetical protein
MFNHGQLGMPPRTLGISRTKDVQQRRSRSFLRAKQHKETYNAVERSGMRRTNNASIAARRLVAVSHRF